MAQSRPTILQIIPHLDTGGAELSAVEIAAAVVRAGGRALVLAEPGRLAPEVVAAGGEVVPFPAATKNPLRMLANARAIARLVAQRGRRPGACQEPGAGLERADGGAAGARPVRHHLSRRLRRDQRGSSASTTA